MKSTRAHWIFVALLVWHLVPALAVGQEPASGAQDPTVAEVEKLIAGLQASSEIAEDRRTAAIEVYQKAVARLKEAETYRSKAENYEAAAKAAPEEQAKVEQELSAAVAPKRRLPTRETPTSEVKQSLREVRAAAKEASRTLEDLRKEPERRKARLDALPNLIAKEKEQLGEVERLIAHPPQTDAPPELAAARRMQLRAGRLALRAKMRALEAERASLAARGELLQARIRLAVRVSDRAQGEVTTWEEIAAERNEKEATDAAREAAVARRDAEVDHPMVRALAERNSALTGETSGIAQRTKELLEQQTAATELLQRIEDEEGDARKRIAVIGLTDTIGLLMRRHRARLPNTERLRAEIGDRNAEVARAQLQKFEIEAEVQDLGDMDRAVQAVLAQVDSSAATDEALAGSLRRHLESRLRYASDFVKESDRLVAALTDINATDRRIIQRTEDYATYIDAHLLWVRSEPPLWQADLETLDDSAAWLLRPSNWAESGDVAGRFAGRNGALSWLILGLLLLVVIGRFALSRGMLSSVSGGIHGQSFSHTLGDLVSAAIRALPFPLALAGIGWMLRAEAASDSFAKAVGDGLGTTAGYWFFLAFMKRIFGEGQLGEARFGWHRPTVELVRRNLGWFLPASVPVLFLMSVFSVSVNDQWRSTAGRFALIVFLALHVVLASRILSPRHGLLSPELLRGHHRSLSRSRVLLWILGIGVPIALAAFSALGYHWTAMMMVGRLMITTAWAFLLLVVHSVLLQGLAVARFNLERNRDLEQVEMGEAAEGATEEGAEPEFETAVLDVAAVDDQSRQLLRTFTVVAALILAWMTWSAMLPPLSLLEEVPLWSHDVQVTENVIGADDVARPTTLIREEAVTLADLVLALVIFIFTGVAVRNVPGLLEVLVLQRLPLLESSRYAVATMVRYAIAILGLALGVGRLGLAWNQMQWLVAAMGVGLGFGLQEIFANFMSGLIVLFERRVRVGDTVTVGDVTGSVTRIRVLATTLSDWDRKEYIVPNKDIISERILNWTLSNKLNRSVIDVGVAYGSDVTRATELLEEVTRKHPETLDDPAPVAVLTSFDDSALNISLRYYLPTLSGRLQIRSDLSRAIIDAFAAAGIEIAFPQLDIHVKPGPEIPPSQPEKGPESEGP